MAQPEAVNQQFYDLHNTLEINNLAFTDVEVESIIKQRDTSEPAYIFAALRTEAPQLQNSIEAI